MKQQGQVFELKTRSHGGEAVWAYRYRIAGRDSPRLQRGGFKSEQAAREALERALGRLRREQGLVEAPRLRELVDLYLAQHGGEPETVAKLRWLLTLLHGIPYHDRHARTRAITRDTVLPGNQAIPGVPNASRDVAGVVSDVSVFCPRAVDDIGNRGWTLEPHEGAFRSLRPRARGR